MTDENIPLYDIEKVTLRRITRRNYRKIIELRVKPEQKDLIASNAVSMTDAYFFREAWMRAIYLGEKPIGFIMLGINSLKYKFITHFKPSCFIWRFMISDEFQEKGYGKRAMRLLINHIKDKYYANELIAYVLPQNKNALEFYKTLGFKITGKRLQVGDLELQLELE
ncbi:MAG: GNAT family N-acetyltransferase [Candidatus Thorarchaeota archaeon]